MKLLILLLFAPFACGDKIISTNSGPIRGISITEKKVEAYLGIPFAKPPVGSLRFSKPVSKIPWKKTYDAKELPPPCVQAIFGLRAADPNKMSEDCLYLNLWVPQGGSFPKPVMVYIYGGAYIAGSTNIETYNGANLSSHGDVIVATMNYRVGSLGFFSGFIDEAPGNIGLHDQVLAIQWIKNNAKQFGGDPDNIVLFGESAGAFSVSMHMISPLSKHLFKRAILQSGSVFHPVYSSKNDLLTAGSQGIAKVLRCADDTKSLMKNPKAVVDCMRKLPARAFSDADLIFFRNYGLLIPRVGDDFLPTDPIDAFHKGEFTSSEVLLGVNKDEGSAFLTMLMPHIFGTFGEKADPATFNETSATALLHALAPAIDGDKVINSYMNRLKYDSNYTYLNAMAEVLGDFIITCSAVYQADYQSLKNVPVYFYQFEYRSPSSHFAEWMGVSHFDEVQYVFGNPMSKKFTKFEEELSSRIMDMWVAFARTGDPNISDGLFWPHYTRKNPKYYSIGQVDNIREKPDKSRCDMWRSVFRAHIGDGDEDFGFFNTPSSN